MGCASCSGELPAYARFCPFCGTPAGPAAPAAAPVEERKVVTVVFCDLVGSTALSGRLDPETLRTVVLRYFDLMRGRLEEFGGTVEKFIGDAVMAVFGVPVTHEDDAGRAVAAALAMIDAVRDLNETELHPALGIRLGVRIGVNTGPAVTSTDVSTRQALVSGETVNIAARLEQHAGEGEVLIGPETRQAAGAAARTEPVGPLRLKGKTEPVTAYRLLGVGEDDPRVSRRFDVPFVGRTRELAALRRALRETAEGRGPGVVTVHGEAGMGKTRLVHEWRAGLGRRHGFGAGRCRPYGEHGSLAPLADAVRELLSEFPDQAAPSGAPRGSGEPEGAGADPADRPQYGSAEHGSPEHGRSGHGPSEIGRSGTGRALAVLSVGLLQDGTPNPSLDDTGAAVVGLLSALARGRPVVLVIDDCQWAGDPLLDLLGTLSGELAGHAVLFVCLARPGVLDRSAGWETVRSRSRSLALPGLTTVEAALVAAGMMGAGAHGGDGSTAEGAASTAGSTESGVLERVLELAGGNPFHLEQLLAALATPGADGGGDLPTTLQALLGARIGALGRAERDTLDLAAVVGREFTADDVIALAAEDRANAPGGGLRLDVEAAVGGGTEQGGTEQGGTALRARVGSALVRLGRHRLVDRADLGADRAGAPLRFSSGLIHEITYQSVAKRVRAERHERAAELLLRESAGEDDGMSAEGTPPGVDGGTPAQAKLWGGGASQAKLWGRNASVAGHLEHAYRYRTELGVVGARTEELRRHAARLLIETGAQALARSDLAWAGNLLARAVDLARSGEPEWPAAARRLGEVHLATGRIEEATALLRSVLTPPPETAAADATLASGFGEPGVGLGGTGKPSPAGGPATCAEEPGGRYPGKDGAVDAAHARLALAVAVPGTYGPAREVAERTLPVFERVGDDFGQARACIRLAQDHQLQGRHVEADTLLTRALSHAERSGAEPERALALGAMGVSLWRGPEPVPAAVARARHLLAEHGERRPTVRLTLNCPLAVLFALQERWDDAHACLAQARRLAGELGYAEGALVLPLFNAAVANLAGDRDGALSLLDEAAAAARALRAGGLLRTVTRESVRLLLDGGRSEEAAVRLAADTERGAGPEQAAPGPASGPDPDRARADAADLDGLLARVAAAQGRAAEAADLAARSVRTAAGTDSPEIQAVAWLDQADVLRRSGRPAEARTAADRAGRRFAAKGHLPGARRAAEFGAALTTGPAAPGRRAEGR